MLLYNEESPLILSLTQLRRKAVEKMIILTKGLQAIEVDNDSSCR